MEPAKPKIQCPLCKSNADWEFVDHQYPEPNVGIRVGWVAWECCGCKETLTFCDNGIIVDDNDTIIASYQICTDSCFWWRECSEDGFDTCYASEESDDAG